MEQPITIAKGIITVQKNEEILYQTQDTTRQTNGTRNNYSDKKITYALPLDESAIQYTDDNGLTQVIPENLPSIRINVKDKNGHLLDTVASIIVEK